MLLYQIFVILCVFLPAQVFAVTVRPTDMETAKNWFETKFAEKKTAAEVSPERKTGLFVLDNHNAIQRNTTHEGRKIRLGETTYERGIYTHANSHVVVRLPGPAKTFSAVFGVDNNHSTSGGRGSARFHVLLGEKEVYTSEIMHGGDPGVAISLELGGATEFTLKVDDAGDGISCDQAEWADAAVTLADGTKLMLDEMVIHDPRYVTTLTDEPPFSFYYGETSSWELLKKWPRTYAVRELEKGKTQRTVTYTDPETGLRVTCVAVAYADFPTVEWTVYFENTGKKDTPILREIRAADVVFPQIVADHMKLRYAVGSPSSMEDYRPLMTEMISDEDERRITTSGGRGSDAHLPYFNVEGDRGEGVLLAVGWPGQWEAFFKHLYVGGLHFRAGQEQTHFKLLPGEKVRTPLMVVQFYSGDHRDAQNVWRQWMLKHNVHTPDGKLETVMTLHACTSDQFWEMVRANTENQMFFIDGYVREKIEIEYWWMDAGWYPCENEWWKTGTWEPDVTRFPNGLREISDHAAKSGIKTLVWFEPERVHRGTWLAENRKEWLLPGGTNSLLNLGNPEAWQWTVDHFDGLIKSQGVNYYRQDFNMAPLDYWRRNDAEDRQGITEIRHVEGYLAFWDELRRRNPGLLIDTCASGGRRNDLETLRRAIPLHRSDYHRDTTGNQCQTYGMAQWIPLFGIGSGGDEYYFRSTVAPCNTYGVDMRLENQDLQFMRDYVAVRNRVKKFFLGDFHPLSGYSLDLSAWMAWQYDLPASAENEKQEGMVQVFRRENSEYEAAVYHLRGLKADATYRVEDLDGGEPREFTGHALMTDGFRLTIPKKRAAKIFIYNEL